MTIQWKFIPADDESVDAETRLFVDGKDTRIGIQHVPYAGGYGVNEIEEEPEWIMTDYGIRKTMKAAKELALATFAKRGMLQ